MTARQTQIETIHYSWGSYTTEMRDLDLEIAVIEGWVDLCCVDGWLYGRLPSEHIGTDPLEDYRMPPWYHRIPGYRKEILRRGGMDIQPPKVKQKRQAKSTRPVKRKQEEKEKPKQRPMMPHLTVKIDPSILPIPCQCGLAPDVGWYAPMDMMIYARWIVYCDQCGVDGWPTRQKERAIYSWNIGEHLDIPLPQPHG